MRTTFRLFSYLICIIFFSISVYSQSEVGKPFITNYFAKDYKGHSQNWSITQDNRGVMFIGNGDGVLVYDGKFWKLIKLPKNVTARTVSKSDEGIIHVGSINEFGYLRPNETGKLEYISIFKSLGIEDIGTVWDIYHINSSTYYRTDKYLIKLQDGKFKTWEASSGFNISFILDNTLYLHDTEAGLFKLINNKLVKALGNESFKNQTFNFAVQIDNEVILANRQHGIFVYDGTNLTKIYCEANKYLKEKLVYRGISYKKDQAIIGTLTGGCIIINKDGKILRTIDTETGLQSNNIHDLFIDKDGQLWLALNKGISKCDISSPLTYWNQSNGLEGITLNITRYKETLYVATHQGLYYIDKTSKMKKFPVNLSQTWYFLNYKAPDTNTEHLLVSSNQGIYLLHNSKLINITQESVPFFMIQSAFNPNIIYVGFSENIGIIEYQNGKFNYLGKIPNTGISVRSIREDIDGNLWVSTFRHGVFKIILSDNLLQPKQIIHYGIESGFKSLKNILIYPYNNRLVFATENGLYEFDKTTDNFKPLNKFKDIFHGEHKDIFSFTEDNEGNIWLAQLNNYKGSIGVAKKNIDGNYNWSSSVFNRIPPMMNLAFYVENNGNVWIGGTEGLFKYTPTAQQNFDQTIQAAIRKVSLRNDSVIFFGNYYAETDNKRHVTNHQNKHLKVRLPYEENSLQFSFTAYDYQHEEETEFTYFLQGYDKTWSDWSLNSTKEYTNLPEGNYTFKIKARNIYNQLSDEATFEFSIKPPWYRTKVAYTFFILLSITVILIIVRISIRRLRNLNTQLERLVEKRTYEINQQKEEILAQSEELSAKNDELEKLSIIARETDNAIAIADPEGKIEWVNEGFRRLYGFTLSDLEKHNYTSLIDFSESEQIKNAIAYCKKNKSSKSYESLNSSKSGKKIWAQTTITPIIDDNDNIVQLIAIDSDITKLKMAELEVMQQKDEIQAQRDFAQQQKQFIEQQNKELEKHRNRLEQLVKERTIDLEIAKEKAEQSDKLKSAFLANMSHEIRTPMNAIIGFSNLLNDDEIGEEDREELVTHIIQNSNTLLHLIDDIIDLSKIEAGQLEINKKSCQINTILHGLLETFSEKRKVLYKENIDIILKPEIENENFTVYTDPLRIQQIITNLIDNALKFTEKGSVEIGYNLHNDRENPSIVFFVKDTGIGLSEEQQTQIFHRFTKFENDKKKLYRGAGLGLAICKNISELLGGNLWVESTIGEGSTFFVRIPYIKVSENETKIDGISNTKASYNWQGKTILVAEDEVSNYRFIEMALSRTNAELIWATDGIEAFELFQKKDVDLILMDIKMPNMDGLEATRRIRKIDAEIPIIAQTAFAMENDEKISLEAGCDSYISKPINKNKLLKLISTFFDKN
ncbi:MAG: response regulator [Bacteroidetes bacterium]|nr:response regulator [Bacteroidota bacterium]